MWEKSTGSFLTNTRRNSNLYHGWHQSWPLSRCDFGYVSAVRSCDIIKGHQNVFANSFAEKRATAPCMVSLCSAHQDASNDIHFDLEVTLRSRDLRSPLDLDLIISFYTYFDAYQREDLDGALNFALTQLVQSYWQKTPLFSSAAILTFLTPVTSFFTWPKSDLSNNCRARPSVSNAVYRLSLACFVFEISGGAVIRPPPSVLRWPGPPSVRGLIAMFEAKAEHFWDYLCQGSGRNLVRKMKFHATLALASDVGWPQHPASNFGREKFATSKVIPEVWAYQLISISSGLPGQLNQLFSKTIVDS